MYEKYWERNGDGESYILTDGFTMQINEINDAVTTISVQCDEPVNGMADVYIDYEVCGRGNLSSKLNILRILKVENSGTVYATQYGNYFESNYLRSDSAEYIPIPIINGYGEITLTATPDRSAYLVLQDASCNAIYTVEADFVEIEKTKELDEGCAIAVINNPKNKNAIDGMIAICYDDVQANVKLIEQENDYIWITLDRNIEYIQGHMGRIIRS